MQPCVLSSGQRVPQRFATLYLMLLLSLFGPFAAVCAQSSPPQGRPVS
jgi:hypothetical protein